MKIEEDRTLLEWFCASRFVFEDTLPAVSRWGCKSMPDSIDLGPVAFLAARIDTVVRSAVLALSAAAAPLYHSMSAPRFIAESSHTLVM